jgi:transposase-like protein
MFSYKERIKAVKLLLQYDMSYSTVIRELGYPSKETLWNWYNEYSQNGDLHQNYIKQPIYSEEEKQREPSIIILSMAEVFHEPLRNLVIPVDQYWINGY